MRAAAVWFCLSTLAIADPRYSSHGNITQIGLPDGRVEFEWLTAASFRLACDWGSPRALIPSVKEAIDYRVTETPASLVFESKDLAVEIDTPGLAVTVRTRQGALVAGDASGLTRMPGKIVLTRSLAKNERIYGLGQARPHNLDIRGTRVAVSQPFFFTTAGYGMSFATGPRYLLDVGAAEPDHLRITAQGSERFEYRFYYGPSPKELFEQRRATGADVAPIPSSATPCDSFRALNAAALSGVLRARLADFPPRDERWRPFLGAYDREVEDRGLPIIHPPVMQFPRDPNAHTKAEVLMLGDELLVVPSCAGRIELPQGIWTDIESDHVYQGRALYQSPSPVSMLARNGSIVPLARGETIELHYFAKLGGEFFIYEPELEEYTQVHAAPSADYWRLEIESKAPRTYEWIVHRAGKSSLRVRASVQAGEDNIVNIPFGITEGP
jgi:alpha-glucosidase (family GH31 glycosyl hydrolase)